MKDNEILKAAIDKAVANGFKMDNHKHFCEVGRDIITGEVISLGAYQSILFDHDFAKAFWLQKDCKKCDGCGVVQNLLWVEFLGKYGYYPTDEQLLEFWGDNFNSHTGMVDNNPEEIECDNCGGTGRDDDWKQHLKAMVLEENPIKYLEKFL